MNNRKYGAAKELYEKALSFNPNDHQVISTLGEINYIIGEKAKGIEFTKKAIELSLANLSYWLQLQKIYKRMGKRKEAKECQSKIDFLKSSEIKD